MRSSKRIALLLTTVVVACLGAPATAYATGVTVTVLPFTEPADVVSNGKQVFISGGIDSTEIVVTNAAGKILRTIKHLPGPADLQLSNDGKTLFVALPDVNEIAVIDTKTLREKVRHSTGDAQCPASLALTGRFLWFGYGCEQWGGNVGRIDLGRNPAVITARLTDMDSYGAPLVASALLNPKVLIVSQATRSPSIAWSYGISSKGKLTLTSESAINGARSNMRDVAIDPTGTIAYSANLSPSTVLSSPMADLTKAGQTYETHATPNAVDVSRDGTRIAGGGGGADEPDVSVFRLDGSVVKAFELGGNRHKLVPSGLGWAPDGRKLYAISNDGSWYRDPGQLHVLTVPAA